MLQARGITKKFPGVTALDKVDFDLLSGEVHILLGENGAGKSTLIKVLSGAFAPDGGEVFIDGQKVEHFDPRVAQHLAVSVIYQELNLAPYLNVAENIFLGRYPKKYGLIDHARMHTEAAAALRSLNMNVDTHSLVIELTTAQQQMVEIAKALMTRSKILIMDEPTSSLSARETEQLFATIHKLTAQGIGIIYISHRLQELHEVGDRVTVLRDGQFIGCKKIDEVTVDELVGMMVGHSVDETFGHDFGPRGAECLRVENLCSGKRLQDVSISLHFGEIVGLAGLVGSGRTDLARAIFGVSSQSSDPSFPSYSTRATLPFFISAALPAEPLVISSDRKLLSVGLCPTTINASTLPWRRSNARKSSYAASGLKAVSSSSSER